jgi:hypothetical protein
MVAGAMGWAAPQDAFGSNKGKSSPHKGNPIEVSGRSP